MYFERFPVGNVEFAAPPSEALSSGVSVISLFFSDDSLSLEPVDCQGGDVIDVSFPESSCFGEPLRVHSLLVPLAHARIELDASQGTVAVPTDFNRWVAFLVNVVSEASWWLDMLLTGA